MTTTEPIAEIADALYEARTNLKQIAPPRETFAVESVEAAQRVQDYNTSRWIKQGRRMVGRKIGLTSKAVQEQFGVNEPDFGILWADYAFQDRSTISMRRLMQPRMEAEVAFVMERAIDNPDASLEELLSSIAYTLPAIEIVDTAVANWNIKLFDTIADNASAGGYVLGTSPRKVTDVDLRLGGVVMSRNAVPVSLGVGAACLGHPFNATLWLARKMATLGRPIGEGDIVLSGALSPMTPAEAGDVYSVEIQGFAPLQVAFAS